MKHKQFPGLWLWLIYLFIVVFLGHFIFALCTGNCFPERIDNPFLSLHEYNDSHLEHLPAILLHRIRMQPFNLIAASIFGCAVIHSFFTRFFTSLSHRLREKNKKQNIAPPDTIGVEILHLLGETEVVFGLWVIPLFLSMAYMYDWKTAFGYIEGIQYVEPLFVVAIMAIASTRPILSAAEDCLGLAAKLGGESVMAWWWAILTLGALSGSFITEPGAMTISALLLAKQFYVWNPRPALAYGTLGLLFTNVSIGGVLTNFAAPPVLMVSKAWEWDLRYMAQTFGWKAAIAILTANTCYYMLFKKDFAELEARRCVCEASSPEIETKTPFWISLVHVFFLAWTVVFNHSPALFLGAFLLFLGFQKATSLYQTPLDLKPPILVGYFLAGLIVLGNLQTWWIAPLLQHTSESVLFIVSTVLTSFNDNAGITYLASLIPSFDEEMKYAILSGAVAGGGLTVIANAPNPTGQSILNKFFQGGISAMELFKMALFPAVNALIIFYLFRSY